MKPVVELGSRPIKIGVMLRHYADPGGISVYTQSILPHLFAAGERHRFRLFSSGGGLKGSLRARNVEEVVIDSRNRLLWDQYWMLGQVNHGDVDLLFNPKLSVPLGARCKTVFTMHGLEQFAAPWIFKKLDRLYFSLAMPLFCRKADAILVMTETGKRDLQKYLRVPAAKIHVVPEAYNPLCRRIEDPRALATVREKYGLPERYVLFVGGITPLKNLPVLLRALSRLQREGLGLKLVLSGFKRWKFSKDLALIDELGLQESVVQTGYVDDADIPALYSLAQCFVLPSFYEGFGIPILEAQACGCPVVSARTGAMPEVAGGAALHFDPLRDDELAGQIHRVLDDEALRARLIAAGFENVKRYSWDATARGTLAVFENLCP